MGVRTVRFHDSYVPALQGGTSYTITLTQHLTWPDASKTPPVELDSKSQEFSVRSPRFVLDASFVHCPHPAPGSRGRYDNVLPHISLTRVFLPWEQTPESGAPEGMRPWLALLVFAAGELPEDLLARGTTTPRTVKDLLGSSKEEDPTVLRPQIGLGTVPKDVQDSTCQTITVPGTVFTQVVPREKELRYLTHLRYVNDRQLTLSDLLDPGHYGVVLSNRLPTLAGTAPVSYVAHLVSLEGCGAYLPGGATPPTPQQSVRLVSLHAWGFTCDPQGRERFTELLEGMAPAGVTAQKLALRLPPVEGADTHKHKEAADQVSWQLERGYVFLPFTLPSGERTVARYRGPLTPVVPPPLPAPPSSYPRLSPASRQQAPDDQEAPGNTGGDRPSPVAGDEPQRWERVESTLIYDKDWGIFDATYAVAFTTGRLLALSDPAGRHAAVRLWQHARAAALTLLAPRVADPHISGLDPCQQNTSPGEPRPALASFHRVLAAGLAALGHTASVLSPPDELATHRVLRERAQRLLACEQVRAHLARVLAERAGPVADFLHRLQNLELLPFTQLIADRRLLPPESLRFFRIDAQWIAAVVDGAYSLWQVSSLDQHLRGAVCQALTAHLQSRNGGGAQAGLLLRSRLIRAWPTTIIDAARDQTPVTITRRQLAADTLLCLFDTTPTMVTISEPHTDLYHGFDDVAGKLRVGLRYLREHHEGQRVTHHVGSGIKDGWFPPTNGPHTLADYLRPNPPRAVVDIDALIHGRGGTLEGMEAFLRTQEFVPGEPELGPQQPLSPAALAVQLVDSATHYDFTPE
jgi:hypothetical protein